MPELEASRHQIYTSQHNNSWVLAGGSLGLLEASSSMHVCMGTHSPVTGDISSKHWGRGTAQQMHHLPTANSFLPPFHPALVFKKRCSVFPGRHTSPTQYICASAKKHLYCQLQTENTVSLILPDVSNRTLKLEKKLVAEIRQTVRGSSWFMSCSLI